MAQIARLGRFLGLVAAMPFSGCVATDTPGDLRLSSVRAGSAPGYAHSAILVGFTSAVNLTRFAAENDVPISSQLFQCSAPERQLLSSVDV